MMIKHYRRWSCLPLVFMACSVAVTARADDAVQQTPIADFAPQTEMVNSSSGAGPQRTCCTPGCSNANGNAANHAHHGVWTRCQSATAAAAYPMCNVHPDPPFGTSYNAIMQAQVARGEAAMMVLYRFDFRPGEAELNHHGQMRLRKLAERMPRNSFPLIIESTPDNLQLDHARHATIAAELAMLPFAVPAERVVIGPPLARGLDGLDAEIIHQTLLGLTASAAGAVAPAAPAAGAAGAAGALPQ